MHGRHQLRQHNSARHYSKSAMRRGSATLMKTQMTKKPTGSQSFESLEVEHVTLLSDIIAQTELTLPGEALFFFFL